MLKGNPPKYRNGACSRCGGVNEKPENGRYCRTCKSAMQKERRERQRSERKTVMQRLEAIEEHLGIGTSVTFTGTA